ncbi:MAG: MFS transporter [Sphaerochaetaceae bacterium]|jgi:fucose permease|nr:MFS transporter [Sphaerochaetaceae bacterium]
MLLLTIIYAAFISLGLPDSLLGSAWPAICESLGVPVSWGGFISMICCAGTVISSLSSERVIGRLGTGKTVFLSTFLTAITLLAWSFTGSYWVLCLMALPLGLGAGSIDVALNNYVALHYKARHMSWLHCFWGIGATIGPMIMAGFLKEGRWQMGYRTVSLIQLALTLVLFLSMGLWKNKDSDPDAPASCGITEDGFGNRLTLALASLSFFLYCTAESTLSMWTSSYAISMLGFDKSQAALLASCFFFGIAGGRLLSGFLTFKIKSETLIVLGLCLISSALLMLVLGWAFPAVIGLGLGCAPIYPSMIMETPVRFGSRKSRRAIGLQMASAYVGSTFMPTLAGVISQRTSFRFIYIAVLACTLLMLASTLAIKAQKPRGLSGKR